MITIDNTWDISPTIKIANNAGGLSAKKFTGRFDPTATNCTWLNITNFTWALSKIFEMNGMSEEVYFTGKSEDISNYSD